MNEEASNDLPWTISAAARQIGVAAETLRAYELRGIVAPTRDSTGRRLYSRADIEAAKSYRARRAGDRAA